MKIAAIMIGGALGALLRFGLSSAFPKEPFPYATLCVNLIGCLLIGVMGCLNTRLNIPAQIQGFIFVGLLGAFTTFSTFALESANLIKSGHIWAFAAYIALSNICGILLAVCGFGLTKMIVGAFD